MGNIGGMPNSTERSSGATKPTASPQGPPSTKPHSRMGKCMGHSMLPTCGTWPVTMGSRKASARNNAASTMRRAGETVLVFMKKSSFAQKRGLLPAFRPETDPFVVSFEKMLWIKSSPVWRKRASARTPGSVPDFDKIIANAPAAVKMRQTTRKLTKKRNFSGKISPCMYILHEGT